MLNHRSTYVMLAVAGVAWMLLQQNVVPSSPTPDEHVDDMGTAAELRLVLTGPQAKEDARYFSSVVAALADRIEQDGRHSTPVMTQRIQLESLIARSGQLAVAGRTTGRYPELPQVIGRFFDKHFPQQQGKLAPEDRAQAVTLLRALSAGFAKAAER